MPTQKSTPSRSARSGSAAHLASETALQETVEKSAKSALETLGILAEAEKLGKKLREDLWSGNLSAEGIVSAVKDSVKNLFDDSRNKGLEAARNNLTASLADSLGLTGIVRNLITPNALGNAYSLGEGQISAQYASGAEVVGLAGHGLGVIGEAGPEAILPLSRRADGRLGVSMSGEGGSRASPPVIFNVTTNDAGSFKRSSSQIASMLTRAVDRGRRSL